VAKKGVSGRLIASMANKGVTGAVRETRAVVEPHSLRGTGKSAQVIDHKGDKVAPLGKRVRKRQKRKGLNEIAS